MHFKRLNIFIFLLLVLIIVFSSLIILKPVFNTGFTGDEWVQLIYYKGYKLNPFVLWSIRGPYTTTPAYFLGILVDIFGLNIQPIQTVNVCLKILATLSIFPLTLYIFKNKLLAFLTTIFYGINHTTAKSLEFPVKGGDYLGIMFMSLFLMVYVYIVRKSIVSLKWLFLLGFIFLVTLMSSPIRIYPLPIFIVFVEIFIFIKKPIFFTIKSSFSRILSIYLIPIIIFFYKPSVIISYLTGLPYLYHRIQGGNFKLFIMPFQGVFYSILTDKQLGWIVNLFRIHSFDSVGFFSTTFGTSVLIMALIFYKRWRKTSSKNTILLAAFVGPFFSFVFIVLTWFFAGALGSFNSQQYYLIIASLGTSLFIASLLTLFYNKFKKNNVLPQLFIIITVILFLKISVDDNYAYFSSTYSYRKGFSEQVIIQKAVKEKIKIIDNHEPILIYLDASSDSQNSGFYERAILTNFGWFMPLQDKQIVDGCLGLFYEPRTNLKKIVHFENGKLVLVYCSVCIENGSINYQRIISYKPENFYAYKLNGYELIDIKKEVLKELNIREN